MLIKQNYDDTIWKHTKNEERATIWDCEKNGCQTDLALGILIIILW